MLNEHNTVFAESGPLYVIGLSLGPPESRTQTVSRSLPNFLQGSLGDRSTDRPTDHATRSFTIGGIYLRSKGKKRKGKVFSAIYICISQRAQTWITQFYLKIHHACRAFVSVHQQQCFIIWVLFERPHMWNELFYLLHSMRHSVTWLNSRCWLAACDWLMSRVMKYDTIAIELPTSRKFCGGIGCLCRT